MGEMADDYAIGSDLAEDFMDRQLRERLPWSPESDGSRKQTARWKTANGEKIRICDMTDDHLRNTIWFLEKRAKQLVRKYLNLRRPQGDIARMLFDGMFEQLAADDAWRDEVPGIYWKMIEDAGRRGLQL